MSDCCWSEVFWSVTWVAGNFRCSCNLHFVLDPLAKTHLPLVLFPSIASFTLLVSFESLRLVRFICLPCFHLGIKNPRRSLVVFSYICIQALHLSSYQSILEFRIILNGMCSAFSLPFLESGNLLAPVHSLQSPLCKMIFNNAVELKPLKLV